MTERDEQGFVKDIKVAIDAISKENKSSKEKVRELIELPFSVEDVLDVVNFVNQETSEEVDVRDELYNLAILNEQLNGFDEMFKSKLEERHNDLVEALMNRMEGVFKMYDENENVQVVNPTTEQPVEVQAPQLEGMTPENFADPMMVNASEPIATLDAPEIVAPTVDPTAFAEPTAYGGMPPMEAPEMVMPVMEPAAPQEVAPMEVPVETYAEPTVEVPEVAEPVMETPVEEPVVENTVPSFEDFINSNNFEMPAEPVSVEEPVAENTVPSFEDFINSNNFEMPVDTYVEPVAEATEVEPAVPVEEPVAEVELPSVEAYEEPVMETPSEETPVNEELVETDEDEEVREIINRYDRLKELEIKVHNDQKQLKELETRADELRTEISNNQEQIKTLAA